jgi:multisubunit Na+/H+ antiporter MnhE subunit
MRFSGLDETGAALLGSLITLTPGTTTLDVDMERRELLLHLLDGSDPEGAVRSIHAELERPLQRIFAPRSLIRDRGAAMNQAPRGSA